MPSSRTPSRVVVCTSSTFIRRPHWDQVMVVDAPARRQPAGGSTWSGAARARRWQRPPAGSRRAAPGRDYPNLASLQLAADQLLEFLLRQDTNPQLLRLGELAPRLLADDDEIGLLRDALPGLPAERLDQILEVLAGFRQG